MKQRNCTKKSGLLYLLACLVLLLSFSPFTAVHAAEDNPATYQVIFDPDDGSGYNEWYKVTVLAGGKITDKPADPQKDGFIFEGWAYAYDGAGSPILWNFENDVVTENTTLWAAWANGTIVAFDPDDGKTTYPDFYKTVVKPGDKVTDIPADPQREGYIFGGWAYAYDENDKPLLWDFNNPVGEENMTLWAVWNKAYLVVFDPENGTEYSDWFKATVPEGGKITDKPDNPARDGYVFKGWYSHLDAEGNPVYWNFDQDVVTGNTTLWASWSEEENNHAGDGNEAAGVSQNGSGNSQDKTSLSSKNPSTGNEGNYFLGVLAVLGVISLGILVTLKNKR